VVVAAVAVVVVIVVVLMLVIVVVAAAPVVVIMIIVVMVVIVVVMVGTELSVLVDHLGELVTLAAPVMVVIVVVLMLVIVVVAAALVVMVIMIVVVLVVMVMMVVMVVMMLEGLLVNVVVETGVVDGVYHPVGEFVLVYIENGAHEVEFHDVVAGEGAVVLDTVVHVDEVEGEARTVLEIDRGLDVAEEASGLSLYVSPDGHEGIRHPGLGIRIPVLYGPGEARGHAAGLVKGRPFVILAHAINS